MEPDGGGGGGFHCDDPEDEVAEEVEELDDVEEGGRGEVGDRRGADAVEKANDCRCVQYWVSDEDDTVAVAVAAEEATVDDCQQRETLEALLCKKR